MNVSLVDIFQKLTKRLLLNSFPKRAKFLQTPQTIVLYRSVKIFERIIQARVNTFVHEKKTLKERQHGFRF